METNPRKTTMVNENEPAALRSCWECNAAHEHLKRAKGLFLCFECGRFYTDGRYLKLCCKCRSPIDDPQLLGEELCARCADPPG